MLPSHSVCLFSWLVNYDSLFSSDSECCLDSFWRANNKISRFRDKSGSIVIMQEFKHSFSLHSSAIVKIHLIASYHFDWHRMLIYYFRMRISASLIFKSQFDAISMSLNCTAKYREVFIPNSWFLLTNQLFMFVDIWLDVCDMVVAYHSTQVTYSDKIDRIRQ